GALAVAVEVGADVGRARRVGLVLEAGCRARAAQRPLEIWHALQERRRLERGLDRDDAVEEPRVPALGALAGPALPRLRPVDRRSVEELDPREAPETRHGLAQQSRAIAQVRSDREKHLRHAVLSTPLSGGG